MSTFVVNSSHQTGNKIIRQSLSSEAVLFRTSEPLGRSLGELLLRDQTSPSLETLRTEHE